MIQLETLILSLDYRRLTNYMYRRTYLRDETNGLYATDSQSSQRYI
jgi:hypothetical protein